ncbi:transposase [Bifidobacterium bifidum]|nr:transposase [Bifidobacterium bifidum]
MACQFNLVLYGPSAPARRISRSRRAGSRACARYRPGSSPRPGCSCGRAARNGGLDAELRQIARARLPVIDEFGYMPIDRTVRHGRLTGFEGGSYRSEHALMTR